MPAPSAVHVVSSPAGYVRANIGGPCRTVRTPEPPARDCLPEV